MKWIYQIYNNLIRLFFLEEGKMIEKLNKLLKHIILSIALFYLAYI